MNNDELTSSVYHGDCLEFMHSYDGPRIDLIVADPPYALDVDGNKGSYTGVAKGKEDFWKQVNVENLALSYDIATVAEEVERLQEGKVNAYFFCNSKQIPEYLAEYVTKRKCKFNILAWHKQNAMPTYYGKYLTDTEFILYFTKGGYCYPESYDDAKTYWVQGINTEDKSRWNHPTIKPMNIVATLIRNSSKEGGLVFDPFLGSGTTRIAAAKQGRKFIGCEKNNEFYELQEARYQHECHSVTTLKNGKTVKQLSFFNN